MLAHIHTSYTSIHLTLVVFTQNYLYSTWYMSRSTVVFASTLAHKTGLRAHDKFFSMSTKQKFEWCPIKNCDTMAAAKSHILNGVVTDDGQTRLQFRWHPKQPGDGRNRCYFLCKSHKDCNFMARAVNVGTCFQCQMVSNVPHTDAEPALIREGCGINMLQQQRIMELIDLGLTAGRIFNELTKAELSKCKLLNMHPPKRVGGGYRGEHSRAHVWHEENTRENS